MNSCEHSQAKSAAAARKHAAQPRARALTQQPLPPARPEQVRVSDLVAAATFYAHFFLAVAGPADRFPAVSSRTRTARAAV